MMTEELTKCPYCSYEKALTHYDSSGLVNWIACPKCRKYFEFGKEIKKEHTPGFWDNVESDTGYRFYCNMCKNRLRKGWNIQHTEHDCKEHEARTHNIVKVEFWIDCGNCTMNQREKSWYIEEIEKLCKQRASKLKDINVYD